MTLHALSSPSQYRSNWAVQYDRALTAEPRFPSAPVSGWSAASLRFDPGAVLRTVGFEPSIDLLKQALNAMANGVILATESGQVRFANRCAVHALSSTPALAKDQERIRFHNPRDQAALMKALTACRVGRRSMLTFGTSDSAIQALAIVPLSTASGGHGDGIVALVTIGNPIGCDPLCLQFFAQAHQLTCSEGSVLEMLCEGMRATQIASCRGVSISTIRSQIRSICHKTRAKGIFEMIRMVTTLPPMVSAINGAHQTTPA